jgi:hypothetical protein
MPPGALARQAAHASAKAALQAQRACYSAAQAVEAAEEMLAVYRRGWNAPWEVLGWRAAIRYTEHDYAADTRKFVASKLDVLHGGISRRNDGLAEAQEAFERKMMAAAKCDKLTVREARQRQARRDLESTTELLSQEIGALQKAAIPFEEMRETGPHCDGNPIAEAARDRRVVTVRRLVREMGRKPTRAEFDVAVKSACPIIVDIFLEGGADVSELDRHGATFLHGACHRGQLEIARLLVRAGAAPDARNTLGRTPLHLACSSYSHFRKTGLVRLLVEEGGADIDARDRRGRTPLHYAAQSGDRGTIALLAEEGADFDALDEQGDTPLSMLQACQQQRVQQLAVGQRLPVELDLRESENLMLRLTGAQSAATDPSEPIERLPSPPPGSSSMPGAGGPVAAGAPEVAGVSASEALRGRRHAARSSTVTAAHVPKHVADMLTTHD